MSVPTRAVLRRYWHDRRSGIFRFDDAAALGAVELGLDVGLKRIEAATAGNCTVLLGPPGAGKTTELERMARALPHKSRVISFGSTGSEDRLREKINAAVKAIVQPNSTPEAPLSILILDSLDESQLTTTQLAGFFEDLLPELPDRLRLVVACRSAGWLSGVEYVLQQNYEEVAIYDLAPLTTEDVKTYASSAGADGAAFLQAVTTAKALPLAASPITLGLLVDEYLAGDQASGLPSTQKELYERSCKRLVQEPNPRRQSPLQPKDIPKLVAIVGHLAIMSLFSGNSSFVLLGDGGQDDLAIDQCLPASVSWHGGADEVSLTPQLVMEGLATAVFTGAGEGRVRFIHQPLAEFLAARRLLTVGLSDKQLDGLLRGRGGLLAPQVQAVAAWLIALAPDRFGALLQDDPAAFLKSSVELTDPDYRRSLVEGLLNLAEGYELPDFWGIGLEGLAYPQIEERLRGVLTNREGSIDIRYLALRITRANRLAGLLGDMVTLVLDEDEVIAMRNAAGHAVLDRGSLPHIRSLGVLANHGGPQNDEDDELFGLGLLALLQSGTAVADLLPQLRGERNTNHMGNYRSLLLLTLPDSILSASLGREDLLATLRWAAAVESSSNRSMSDATGLIGHADKLFDAILVAGLRRLDDPGVLPAVAHLIAIRLDKHYKLRRDQSTELPQLADPPRRRLLDALNEELGAPHDVWFLASSSSLLRTDDLFWVLDKARDASTSAERSEWGMWIRATYDRSRSDHEEGLRRLLTESPEYQEALGNLLHLPVSPSAKDVNDGQEDEDAAGPTPTDDELRTRMVECLSLDDKKSFFYFCHWAQFKGGERYSHHDIEIDVRQLPGWMLLTNEQHMRVAALAERYLREAEPDVESMLGTGRYSTGAFAGARAMVLLSELGVAYSLPDERWQFWAPALVGGPLSSSDDSLLASPLRQVYEHAPDALLAAAEKEMRGKPEFGQFALRRLTPALTVEAVPWLVQAINNEAFDNATAGVAFGQLLALDRDAAFRLLGEKINAGASAAGMPPGRRHQLVAEALHHAPSTAWGVGYAALSSDDDLAREVIGPLAHFREFDSAGLTEDQVMELWTLTNRLFPPEDDPGVRGFHRVSARESIARFRDHLLPSLAERGTLAATTALRRLAEEHPEEPLYRRLVARAEAVLRRSDWTPLLPPELLTVLAGGKRVLRSDQDLLDVVLEALDEVQVELQGATSPVNLLWNHVSGCKPKGEVGCTPKSEDEISDFLDREIERSAPGVVVNREVQVSRISASGLGRRTDILVQVPGPAESGRTLRVVIEVKGCWNSEISTALEDQLVAKYLTKWSGSAGIFLVAWFDPSHGFRSGTWLKDPVRGNRDELSKNLGARAEAISISSGHVVRSVVLDCSMPSK